MLQHVYLKNCFGHLQFMLYKYLSAVRSPLAAGPPQAKINYIHLTEINSRHYGLLLISKDTDSRSLHSVRWPIKRAVCTTHWLWWL